MISSRDILDGLWQAVGLSPAESPIVLPGIEPALPSSFRIGAAAQASIGAATLASAEIFRLRTGRTQTASVEMQHAALAFNSGA